MTPNAKEAPAKIFCHFHQKVDCVCIDPVIDNDMLFKRLEHQIKLNEILLKHEPDRTKIDNLTAQRDDCRARLETLRAG